MLCARRLSANDIACKRVRSIFKAALSLVRGAFPESYNKDFLCRKSRPHFYKTRALTVTAARL